MVKHTIAAIAAAIAISAILSDAGWAEPVLLFDETYDIIAAEYSCRWAEGEIKSDQYLIKALKCGESELCQRAIEIEAACKVSGAAAEVRAFHSKLLAQFASNAQCTIAIMRLPDGISDKALKDRLEALRRANWELHLDFIPGTAKQSWQLLPFQSGPVLEGEGDAAQIARDVCTIITRSGAKILN